jgi:hypothetical protein
MATQDISRRLFQPAKYYSSARMQQGRAILDSDFNEAEMLGDEGQRVVVTDVVGPHGSSTAGFTIGNFQDDPYDFDIGAGSYHLGGLRFQIERAASGGPQRFRSQTDWLQSSRADYTFPAAPEVDRSDLVYLVGWEQTVSAVEDLELVEHALGGRDTTVRQRRMQRVRVVEGTDDDCATAFTALISDFQGDGHTFDDKNNELKSSARLTVTLAAAEAEAEGSDDQCNLPIEEKYTGGENQAIRVQMIAEDRFLWALDNASPLYRVTAARSGTTVTITFLTPPQEQALFPLKDQVVEILPWGAALPNGEHIADHPIADGIGGGVYARTTVSYNPVTTQLTATLVDTTLFDQMLAWFAAGVSPFFFLRVWKADGAPAGTFGLASGTAHVLPGTGLSVTVTGTGIVGDHWIIAARTATPTQLVPWDLLGNLVPPHGPRRFYCPLGMLRWVTEDPPLESLPVIHSCRRPFRPLTHLRDCCNVTVGDGVTSFGDYTSIQTAINALPTNSPGKVCILPGIYEERVVITNRSDLVLEGCGPRTLLRTPPLNSTSGGLVTLMQCKGVTLRNFAMDATGQYGITVGAGSSAGAGYCNQIILEKLIVTTRRDASLPSPVVSALAVTPGSAPFPLCTVMTNGASDVRVLDCTFTEIGDLSAAANVLFMNTSDATIRNCKILSPPREGASASRAWGGLQIAGGCNGVTVERCLIEGGLGHGITLGSAHIKTTSSHPNQPGPGAGSSFFPNDDCPSVYLGLPLANAGPRDDPAPTVLIPDAGPNDLRIRRNRIRGMGGSGISVLGFWPEPPNLDSLTQISIHDLVIADNRIEDNCMHPPEGETPAAVREVAAFGGVVLASARTLRIHDNIIRKNGADHRHAVCGIYVLHGEDITVENNQITDNGHRVPGTAFAGHRAGIALQLVGRPLRGTPATDPSQPAARVRGNTVLQPAGRALQIYGIGPIYVEGNVLVSQGLDGISGDERQRAAHCIDIRNVGVSPELITEDVVPSKILMQAVPPMVLPEPAVRPDLLDGRILFTNNMVRFAPVAGAGNDIRCATLLHSYGDVAVLGNQFLATLTAGEGPMLHDTIVLAWSTRTTGNRWEDPLAASDTQPPITTVSATTVAHMNTTTLNQASRCIHVYATPGDVENNPINNNQHFSDNLCEPDPEFAGPIPG